jgi:hypothetical protein
MANVVSEHAGSGTCRGRLFFDPPTSLTHLAPILPSSRSTARLARSPPSAISPWTTVAGSSTR